MFVSQTTIHQFEDLGYTVVKLPGDANDDGTVNGADLNIVLANSIRRAWTGHTATSTATARSTAGT